MSKTKLDGKCLLWQGALGTNGYGHMRWQGREWGAHRLALVWHTGYDRPGMYALHSCGKKSCVNHAHLRWGTNQENAADAKQAKAYRSGVAHYKALLDPDTAIYIWNAYYRDRKAISEIAKTIGVKDTCCTGVVYRKTWKHVTDTLPRPKRPKIIVNQSGEAGPRARLTEKQVLWIRANLKSCGMSEKLKRTAHSMGVSEACIRRILYGISWRHILPGHKP